MLSDKIEITHQSLRLPGHFVVPSKCKGIVIFAHGSGSSRNSPRNIKVAQFLNQKGLGTLLFDLLTPREAENRENVFDIPLLAHRLILATHWIRNQEKAKSLPIGFFGASTGGGAALWAAAELGHAVSAVVSRGGRPDLAIPRLREVTAPTLLIVGSDDDVVIQMNQEAMNYLNEVSLFIVPGATHLFEETGALETVAEQSKNWFIHHFKKAKLKSAA